MLCWFSVPMSFKLTKIITRHNFMKSNCSTLTLNEEKALNEVLMTWGALTRLESGGALGALPTNLLHTFAKLGVRVSKSQQGIQWPNEVEKIDRLIGKLHRVKPKWATAVKQRYTETGDIRQQAKKHDLPKSTYYEQFQHGREWLGQEFYRQH